MQTFCFIPAMIVAAFVGSYSGKEKLDIIPQQTFRKITLGLIMAIGISLVFNEIRITIGPPQSWASKSVHLR